jgi:DNA polymerase I
VIQYTADQYVDLVNQYAREQGYEPNSYLVSGDTDSCQCAIPQAPDFETALKWANRASEAFDGTPEDPGLYDEFMEREFGVVIGEDEHRMDVEVESLASALFFMRDHEASSTRGSVDTDPAVKKRYAQHMVWDDDNGWLDSSVQNLSSMTYDDYDRPELGAEDPTDHVTIKGFEYVRSDSATVTRDAQLQVLTDILLSDDPIDRIGPYLTGLVEDFESGTRPIGDIGRPKGISSDLDDYGWKDLSELQPDTSYTVRESDKQHGGRYISTPQPVYRGAKYADEHLTWEDLGAGSKPTRLYIDSVRPDGPFPEVYTYDSYPQDDRPDPPEVDRPVDAIAVDSPERLPDAFDLDIDLMIDKELRDKINPIIRTIGADWDDIVGDGRQVGLDQFV